MSQFCVYQVDLNSLPPGLDNPRLQARLYVDGAQVYDGDLPVDTRRVFIAVPAGSTSKFLTGSSDASKSLPASWADKPLQIRGEEVDQGDYQVAHLGHSEQSRPGVSLSASELGIEITEEEPAQPAPETAAEVNTAEEDNPTNTAEPTLPEETPMENSEPKPEDSESPTTSSEPPAADAESERLV